ncbi:MAG: DUF6929 family protein [Chitinophagaceae bacterium]
MQKWRIYRLLVILILSIPSKASAQELQLLKTTYLPHYPSASTLAYHNGRLYVMGDDAVQMLVLNKDHQPIDSLRLFKGSEKRLAKEIKTDIESSAFIQKEKETFLVLFSSFSSPTRRQVFAINVESKKVKRNFRRFNKKPQLPRINEWNIEGAACAGGHLLFSNRANYTHRTNFLLAMPSNLKKGFQKSKPAVISIQLPPSENVIGVSGLAYIAEKDLLLLTATTEITDNAYTDGEIGDSYLGYITNLSAKLKDSTIRVEKLLNLTPVLAQPYLQKIESVAVEEVTGDKAVLHLASDNDNGESTLFKMIFTLPAK